MRTYVSDIAFTKAVKAVQEELGSREAYAAMERGGGWKDAVTDDLAAFLARRDSFYLSSVGADGHPYIQHRGGPAGFLKVIDTKTLGFADFAGNRQYITLGNLRGTDKVCLFVMDYANRRRVKIWGTARVVTDDAALLQSLIVDGYDATPERAIVITIAAWDANCPQHIQRRYTEDHIAPLLAQRDARIAELEAALAAAKGG